MKSIGWIFFSAAVWIGAGPSYAEEPIARISLSQQFVVRGLPLTKPSDVLSDGNADFVHLEPATLVVSCERIKQAILRELKLADQWRGKIYIQLRPRRLDDEPLKVTASAFQDGWVYSLDIPERVHRQRLLTTLVDVLLLEIAYREAEDGASEHPPPWMGTGLASHLESISAGELFVEPFSRTVTVHKRDTAIQALRLHLRSYPPLSLDQLNWPGRASDNATQIHYRACAHLLVSELLQQPKGPESFQKMLRLLPKHLNWQTSFLKAFSHSFSRLVDLDKWWTVAVAHFVGVDVAKTLPFADSLEQLTGLLHIPLDVTVDTAPIPNGTTATLQRIIEEWEPFRLDPVLNRRIGQLEGLQWRSTPELAALTHQYRQVLQSYLIERASAGSSTASKNLLLPNAKLLTKKVIRELDTLDRARSRLIAQQAALSQSRK